MASFSYGQGELANPFIGFGDFFVDTFGGDVKMGELYASFFFQFSYAATGNSETEARQNCKYSEGTTIISGSMTERTNFYFYIFFSLFNTFVFCVPACWLWSERGFLRVLGVVDVAGSCGVNLVGGTGALVAAVMLGPRMGRWDAVRETPLGSAGNAIIGLFMLWWAWIAFNQVTSTDCQGGLGSQGMSSLQGSTFGISGKRWILAIKATITSILASFSGGLVGLAYSFITKRGKTDVMLACNGILGGLVSVMAGCVSPPGCES